MESLKKIVRQLLVLKNHLKGSFSPLMLCAPRYSYCLVEEDIDCFFSSSLIISFSAHQVSIFTESEKVLSFYRSSLIFIKYGGALCAKWQPGG